MSKEQKFFLCKHCGNLIAFINNSGAPIVCCGDEMTELIPNTVDAAGEKHLPVIIIDKDLVKVNIGSVAHPMVEAHYIQWIYIQTERGGQRKRLNPGEAPEAIFSLKNDKLIAAFEFCNLHGLWKTEV